MSLGFYEVWLVQGVGNFNAFMSLLKQFYSKLGKQINSTRALFYRSIAIFQFQPYLENISVFKFCHALSKLRISSHRLEVEAGR